jgi:cytochrome c biogenesis protein CcdA
MIRSSRRVTVFAWVVLTIYVVYTLAAVHKSIVQVVFSTIVVAIGLLTIVSLLRGREPWWTETRRTIERLRALRRPR